MSITNRLFFALLILMTNEIYGQCISGNCENGSGIYVYPEKSRYEGDWKNSKKNGKGKYIYSTGDIYDGSWVDGQMHGYGKYTFHNGSYYEGNFKNGVEEGEGKFVGDDGAIQTGKFINGKVNGFGNITFKSGAKYTGYFLNDKMDGNGTYYDSNGDRFEGQFKDGKKNGTGTKYFSKGGVLKGVWLNGEFVSGSNTSKSNNSIQDSSAISLVKSKQGVYETSVLINGVLKLDMIFDSGAAEVFFTPDIVLTLFRTKTITDEDILAGGSYADANGNVNKSIRFKIRELNLGGIVLKDIAAGVSSSLDGMNLLGLSAIEKLGKIEIDFANGAVITKKF